MKDIIQYIESYLDNLERDSERIQKAMDEYQNYEDDEYRDLEIEDISTNGQIMATNHILEYIRENA